MTILKEISHINIVITTIIIIIIQIQETIINFTVIFLAKIMEIIITSNEMLIMLLNPHHQG